MSLLVPLALLGLLTIPAIVLLHLLRNRRELLSVSSLRLWQGLQQQRQGLRPRNIPLTVLLILQLCVASALTLALAQPVFSSLRSRPQHTIFILDTTTSMWAEDARPPDGPQFISENTVLETLQRRFDVARQVIQARLQTLGDNDSFVIIGLNRRPAVLLSGEGAQKTAAQMTLDNVVPGGTGLDLPAALTLANGLLADERRNRIEVLTDGNYTIDPEKLPAVFAPVEWTIVGPGPSASGFPIFANQALLNVSSRPLPDGRRRLFARIVNYGAEAVERTLQVSVDGRPVDELVVQLGPKAEAAEVWTLPATAQTALVEIVDPDILPVDNRAELLLDRTSRYEVLILSDEALLDNPNRSSLALSRALAAQPGLSLTVDPMETVTPNDLRDFDLVVFDGLPPTLTAWPAGSLLVVNPPLGHPLLPAQNYARDLRHDPEQVSPLLTGVDLSGVYFNRLPNLEAPSWAEIDAVAVSATNTGERFPLILHGDVGPSQVVVWTFDLAQSNLSARLALPLLTANTLSTLLSTSPPPVAPLGEPIALDRNVNIELPGGRQLSLSADVSSASQFTHTKQAGLYRIYNQRGELIGGFSIQAGSALESNLSTHFDPETLNRLDIGAAVAAPDIKNDPYWPWLAGAALVFIMFEGWLAWRK